jgi:hypothetical protein
MPRQYPKPVGWDGGPDGSIQRQGSSGRISVNPGTDLGEKVARLDRDNDLDWDHADFGCPEYAGQKYPLDQTHDDWDEYDPGQGATDRY